MKVLFMGTPEFAARSLEALLKSSHTVVGVITQPDRALKRGKTEISAVKKLALEVGLTVLQPPRLRDEADKVRAFGADIGVTAAYGQILTADILDAFPCGVVNVHASLLPRYRGASPIQSAIAAGERETGVTIMRTELGLDTGDILSVAATPIAAGETAGELTERLADMGAELLVKTLDRYADIAPRKQDEALATHCKTIKKQEQYIDFDLDAATVVNRIHSLSPVPCAKTSINGETYKIYRAAVCDASGVPGEIVCSDGKLVIACAVGGIEVLMLQAPSKRALGIAEFLRGNRFRKGVICAKPQ